MALAYVIVILLVATLAQVTEQCQPGADCRFGEWEAWSDCSKTCGGTGTHSRRRDILNHPDNGGQECSQVQNELVREKASCQGHPPGRPDNPYGPCPIDCVWDQWTSWTDCSVTCAEGLHTRERVEAVEENYGGDPCVGDADEEEVCNGHPAGDPDNPYGPCEIDCVWADWTCGDCTVTCAGGTKPCTRVEDPAAQYGGVNCSGNATQDQACNEQPCPIDCEWSEWSPFGDCSVTCAEGVHTRTRTKAIPDEHGGDACEGDDEEEEACNGHPAGDPDSEYGPCPIDCVWGEFTCGDCTVSCGGGGTKVCTRVEDTALAFGGAACSGPASIPTDCGMDGCPVDCDWGEWGAWGACSITCGGAGLQTRARSKNVEESNGGAACEGTASGTMGCVIADPCPVDCVMGEWGPWDACTLSCGTGSQTATRTKTTPESNGGTCTDSDTSKDQPCNPAPCPINGEYASWSEWYEWESYKSRRCNQVGTTTLWRSASANGGTGCDSGDGSEDTGGTCYKKNPTVGDGDGEFNYCT